MRQALIALAGHVILFALTLYLATMLVRIGLIDLFFWSGIVIGLWAALGTPRAWVFSSFLAVLQPIVQAVVIVQRMLVYEHARLSDPHSSPTESEGAEVFMILDLFKSLIVVLITIAVARGGVALVRRVKRGTEERDACYESCTGVSLLRRLGASACLRS